jgi:hypothetical protein
MDYNEDMQDKELVEIITKIVQNFDPQAPIEQDDAVFNLQFMEHTEALTKKSLKTLRRKALVVAPNATIFDAKEAAYKKE